MDLPPHLEYAFLEGDDKLSRHMHNYLSMDEKQLLIKDSYGKRTTRTGGACAHQRPGELQRITMSSKRSGENELFPTDWLRGGVCALTTVTFKFPSTLLKIKKRPHSRVLMERSPIVACLSAYEMPRARSQRCLDDEDAHELVKNSDPHCPTSGEKFHNVMRFLKIPTKFVNLCRCFGRVIYGAVPVFMRVTIIYSWRGYSIYLYILGVGYMRDMREACDLNGAAVKRPVENHFLGRPREVKDGGEKERRSLQKRSLGSDLKRRYGGIAQLSENNVLVLLEHYSSKPMSITSTRLTYSMIL
ncbi:hypothetical protein Tco_0793273 [Tanacetum coccineum]